MGGGIVGGAILVVVVLIALLGDMKGTWLIGGLFALAMYGGIFETLIAYFSGNSFALGAGIFLIYALYSMGKKKPAGGTP